MTEFLTVVAAIDDSDSAPDVVRVASALVDPKAGDRLFAAHAVRGLDRAAEDLLVPYACFGDDHDTLALELVRGGVKRATGAVRKLLPGPPEESIRVGHGKPAEIVPQLLAELGPDVVVVGPGDHAGGGARAMGAVPVAIAGLSSADLLFAQPVEGDVEIRRIIAAVDLSADSAQVLGRALTLAHRLGAKVQPVFVVPTASSADHAGVLPNEGGISGKMRKAIGGRWAQLESQLDVTYPVAAKLKDLLRKQFVTSGDPATAIVEAAEEMSVDLVVMGRSRSDADVARLGRVADRVARTAPCHVLLAALEAPEPLVAK